LEQGGCGAQGEGGDDEGGGDDDDADGGGHSVVLGDEELLVDDVGQGRRAQSAGGHGEDHVEVLHDVDRAQQSGEFDVAAQVGQGDEAEGLPVSGTVDERRLVDVHRPG